MRHAGVCTICFNTHPVEAALDLCIEAGTTGIELWGRDHLPADATALETARVKTLAERRGLAIAVYGAYARAGEAEWPAARIAGLLDRVADLDCRCTRVWAGSVPSAQAAPADWQRVAAALRAWGELAAARGQRIVVERHCGTLTDFGDSAARLLALVDHPAVRLNYQAPYPWTADAYATAMTDDLRTYLPLSAQMHVQNYRIDDGQFVRVPLADGVIDFTAWRPLLDAASFDGWAMLEFLPETVDLPAGQLARRELAVLRRLLGSEAPNME